MWPIVVAPVVPVAIVVLVVLIVVLVVVVVGVVLSLVVLLRVAIDEPVRRCSGVLASVLKTHAQFFVTPMQRVRSMLMFQHWSIDLNCGALLNL